MDVEARMFRVVILNYGNVTEVWVRTENSIYFCLQP